MTTQPAVIDSTDAATVAKIESLLRPVAKFKERSYETFKAKHLPVLSGMVKATASSSSSASGTSSAAQPSVSKISVVLLGDSMLERMLTTGMPRHAPPLPCLGDWPPPKLMSHADLETALAPLGESPASRLPNVLNLGVGGDRIQNIAYRMIGQPSDSSKPLEGYTRYLIQLRSVKLWVLQAGTNNLHPKHKTGLSDQDISALEQLLRALLIIPSNEQGDACSRILLTGLFKRSDVSKEIITASNEKLKGLVEKVNGVQDPEGGVDRVVYMPPAKAIGDEDDFFVDHVHFSLQGYEEWMKELVPGVYRCLGECA